MPLHRHLGRCLLNGAEIVLGELDGRRRDVLLEPVRKPLPSGLKGTTAERNKEIISCSSRGGP